MKKTFPVFRLSSELRDRIHAEVGSLEVGPLRLGFFAGDENNALKAKCYRAKVFEFPKKNLSLVSRDFRDEFEIEVYHSATLQVEAIRNNADDGNLEFCPVDTNGEVIKWISRVLHLNISTSYGTARECMPGGQFATPPFIRQNLLTRALPMSEEDYKSLLLFLVSRRRSLRSIELHKPVHARTYCATGEEFYQQAKTTLRGFLTHTTIRSQRNGARFAIPVDLRLFLRNRLVEYPKSYQPTAEDRRKCPYACNRGWHLFANCLDIMTSIRVVHVARQADEVEFSWCGF